MPSVEERSHSPPRRKRKRARVAPTSDASTPNLATIFHGLPPVPIKTSEQSDPLAVSADVDSTPLDIESKTGVEMEAVQLEARRRLNEVGSITSPLDISRPPTAPIRPLAPISRLLNSRSNESAQLLHSNDALSSVPFDSSPQETEGNPKHSIMARSDSVGSAYWAARVLSPLFRQEHGEKEKRRGSRIIRQSTVLSAESSDDEDQKAQLDTDEDWGSSHIVSVDDFLSNIGGAVSGCTTRGMTKKYTSKGVAKATKSSPQSKSSERRKRFKRRKMVLADYTSSDSDDYSNKKDSRQRPTSSRLHEMLKTPRTISKTPRKPLAPLRVFLGADSIIPGIIPPTPYPTRPKSNRTHLEFSRASQLTADELEVYNRKKQKLAGERRKVIARDWKGVKGDTFLASIEDTSFGGTLPLPAGAFPKQRNPTKEGHASITSRAFSVEKISKLVTPFIRFPRGREGNKLDRPTRTSFVPLDLIAEEQTNAVDSSLHAGNKKSRGTPKAVKSKSRLNLPPTPTSLPLHSTIDTPFQEDVLSMTRSFRRTLKRKANTGASTIISTIEEADVDEVLGGAKPPADGHLGQEESEPELEDLIALLPTPAVTRFRFITGAKAKRRPTLQFVPQEEAGSYASLASPLNEDNHDLSDCHPRLDMIPQSEYAMERAVLDAERFDDEERRFGDGRKVEYAFEGEEWDSNPSFEDSRMPITNSFLTLLDKCDELPPRSCSALSTPEDQVATSPLRRHVTFSSPSPAKSYYNRKISGKHSHLLNHRSATTSLLSQKGSIHLTSARQLSAKKPLRKMSLVPDFRFASSKASATRIVDTETLEEVPELRNEQPNIVSSLSPLPFPPANQLGCDELIYASSPNFSQMEGVKSLDALLDGEAGTFERELIKVAAAFDNIEDSCMERGAVNIAPNPATSGTEGHGIDLNLQLFCDPHAILPLPSSLPAGISARPPRRTRTWGGSRLTELGFGEGV